MGQQCSNSPISSGGDAAGEVLKVLHVDVSVQGIHDPSIRMLDIVRDAWLTLIHRPVRLHPYVEIIVGQTRVITDSCEAYVDGQATFGRSSLCLMLPMARFARGDGTRDLKKMTLRVWNKSWGPSLRGDALIGQVDLHLNMSTLAGKECDVCLGISRRGLHRGHIMVKYSLRSADSAFNVLHRTGQHSLLEVAEALAQVLQGKNGLKILKSALPKELVPSGGSVLPVHDPLHEILVSLCNQASMLADESDHEVFQRFGRLSRSVQDFVAKYAGCDADVTALAEKWIRKVFKACAKSEVETATFLPQLKTLDEDRLQKFIAAGKKFPGINDLIPIDCYGNEIKDWRIVAPNVPQLAIIGEGGFGEVWRAKDSRSDEWYAVKNSRRPRSRLVQREIAVTDHVLMRPHPCIVQIFGTHYLDALQKTSLIMEFCAGGDFLQEIKRWIQAARVTGATSMAAPATTIMAAPAVTYANTATSEPHATIAALATTFTGITRAAPAAPAGPSDYKPPREATFYLAQILLGLEHLHTKLKTLLRDLKPENVVLTRRGRHLRAKLTDFGLSRIGAESNGAWTLQNAPPGSPHYIAPEVVLRKPYGPAADIYSFGVLVWVALTGGLKEKPGIPPCVAIAYDNYYEGYAENWRLLKRCVTDPTSNGARPLPCVASADFVLKLTKEYPSHRLDYTAVRSHAFTHQMNLPPDASNTEAINAWLEQYEASLASQACADAQTEFSSFGNEDGHHSLQRGLPVIEESPTSQADVSASNPGGDSSRQMRQADVPCIEETPSGRCPAWVARLSEILVQARPPCCQC